MRTLIFYATCLLSANAQAQFVLVVSNSASLGTPGLGSLQTLPFAVVHASSGKSVRGMLGNDFPVPAYYVYQNGAWRAHARNNVTGNLGPGRTGNEANHVFFSVSQFSQDFGGNEALAFVGSAGAPGGSGGKGYWLWNGVANTEIARQGATTGALTPNLGAGWRFGTTGSDYQDKELLILDNGTVVIDALLISPADSLRYGVFLHRPGVGNVPCLLNNDTGALGPAIAGEKFSIGQYAPATVNNRVFITASIDSSEGVWEVCANNGASAPTPLAVSGRSGSLGPNVGPTARFATLRSGISTFGNADLAFAASYRIEPNATLSNGIFRHSAGVNSLLVAASVDSALGPNYQNAVFEALDDGNQTQVRTAGDVLALKGVARRPNNSTVTGLWRMRLGAPPAAVALVGEGGSVAPGVGQTFSNIGAWAVFSDGVIVALCTVNNGPSGLYRFVPGRTPELLLANGQVIAVANGANTVAMTVNSFSLFGAAASQHSRGADDWAGANGNVLLSANGVVSGEPGVQVILSLSATNPDRWFASGFE